MSNKQFLRPLVNILIVLFVMSSTTGYCGGGIIKQPNVAGGFYSADPQELSSDIETYLSKVSEGEVSHKPQVVIAPHAGYVYSAPVAAHTFKAIAPFSYKTVVVIAPSHFFPFEGISVWPEGGFKTPLGVVPVDEDFAKALLKENPKFQFLPDVFEREHALEVELPFLQKVLPGVNIVPILMGQPDPKVCVGLAGALDKLIGQRDDVLVLASSDMSHYHPYDFANRMDAATLEAVAAIDPEKLFNSCMSRTMEMCGFVPVTTALIFAKRRGLTAQVLKYANSGDTAGDKTRVVGYSSVIFYKDTTALNAGQKKELLTLARNTIETFVKTGKREEINTSDPRLSVQEGVFVTIRKHGQLRGCIGNIIGQKPLAQTVRDMAVAAASQDPRFPPVSAGELKDIDVEISVLSTPQQIKDVSEIELGKHGVIVSDGVNHQGVFLPQVATETGWTKEEFLSQLCSQKAGLASDAWKTTDVQLYTFTADVFAE